jgi:2,4-dienoyl-CoA reductase-like NADH-dependent reductase (Old Yellow Enzyme family)
MEVSLFENAENWQAVIRLLSAQPIEAISVSTYDFSKPAFATEKTLAALTREVTTLPIFICGKIYDRATAEAALEHADVILSAKSLLLNPNWVDDLKNNRPLAAFASADANIAYTETPLL